MEYEHGFGAVESGEDARDYGIAAAGQYPASFMLPRLPAVRHQGSIGSCAAHSCAYVNEFYDNFAFSTDFVYGYRPADYYQDRGMKMREACATLLKVGNVPLDDCSGNTEVPSVTAKINGKLSALLPLAAKNRVVSYARIYTTDEAKSALLGGMPVIVVIRTYNDFGADKDGKLQNNLSAGLRGAHAMTLFGWDDAKDAFYTANSWGRAWGKGGFCWLPYAHIGNENYVREMWVIADEYRAELILRTLRKGHTGEDVKALQAALSRLGFDCGTADGIFGARTETAVRAAQRAYKLAVDGLAGKNTRAALGI